MTASAEAQLSLLDPPGRPPSPTTVGIAARDRLAGRHAEEIAALIPIAQALALRAGSLGIIAADVRLAGVQQGILPARPVGRSLSWIGVVMLAADLVPTGEYRRSFLARSNGNLQRVYVHPDFAPRREA